MNKKPRKRGFFHAAFSGMILKRGDHLFTGKGTALPQAKGAVPFEDYVTDCFGQRRTLLKNMGTNITGTAPSRGSPLHGCAVDLSLALQAA